VFHPKPSVIRLEKKKKKEKAARNYPGIKSRKGKIKK
jgi:hypothetical protein